MDRLMRQTRSIASEFTTRDNGDSPTIEGYFAVFNSNYDIAQGMSESIAPSAFEGQLSGDVRALVNHDTTLVLGRTTAHTLELRTDEHGLWGKITINPKDGDAMNLYERVKRGDVSQCSFGFDITDEESTISENGDIHWTIKGVELYEVSCCTFPAYESTNISARSKERDEIISRANDAWRERMKERLHYGSKGNNAAEED